MAPADVLKRSNAAPRGPPVKGFLRFGRKRRSIGETDKRSGPPKFLRFGRSRANSLVKSELADECSRLETLIYAILNRGSAQAPKESEV